jgi:hypothetical protein
LWEKQVVVRALFKVETEFTLKNCGIRCKNSMSNGHIQKEERIMSTAPDDKGDRCNFKKAKVKVKVTLWLAVYLQSVHLGVKPLETHSQRSFIFSTESLR